MTALGSSVSEDCDDIADAQSRVDAYGEAVAAAAVERAVSELAACRDADDPEEAVAPAERAVLERLASRVVERTLPDVDPAVAGGVDDADSGGGVVAAGGVDEGAVAATVAALFAED